MPRYIFCGAPGRWTPGETYDLTHAPTSPDWQPADQPEPQELPEPQESPAEHAPEETQ